MYQSGLWSLPHRDHGAKNPVCMNQCGVLCPKGKDIFIFRDQYLPYLPYL